MQKSHRPWREARDVAEAVALAAEYLKAAVEPVHGEVSDTVVICAGVVRNRGVVGQLAQHPHNIFCFNGPSHWVLQ